MVGSDPQFGVYSAWNVVTQWHAPAFPNMGFNLQRLYEDTTHQYYQLSFSSMFTPGAPPGQIAGGIWHDAGDPSRGGAIWTDRWYHFVVHIVFGATPYPGSGAPANSPGTENVNGKIELWESIDDVPGSTTLTQQAFNGVHDTNPGSTTYIGAQCYPGSSTTECFTDTMDPTDVGFVSMKQGVYRNPTLSDPPASSCPLPLDNGACPTTMYYKDTAVGTALPDVSPAVKCSSVSCATGCCNTSNQCITDETAPACGTGGAECMSCGTGSCTNSACTAPPPPGCGPETCPTGCCDNAGVCQPGTTNAFCGGPSGGACETCSPGADRTSCTNRLCMPF